MIGSKPVKVDHFAKTFCLVLGWLEVAYESLYDKGIWIWEADEATGRLVLIGDPELAQQFQHEAGLIIAGTPDPKQEWRKF